MSFYRFEKKTSFGRKTKKKKKPKTKLVFETAKRFKNRYVGKKFGNRVVISAVRRWRLSPAAVVWGEMALSERSVYRSEARRKRWAITTTTTATVVSSAPRPRGPRSSRIRVPEGGERWQTGNEKKNHTPSLFDENVSCSRAPSGTVPAEKRSRVVFVPTPDVESWENVTASRPVTGDGLASSRIAVFWFFLYHIFIYYDIDSD